MSEQESTVATPTPGKLASVGKSEPANMSNRLNVANQGQNPQQPSSSAEQVTTDKPPTEQPPGQEPGQQQQQQQPELPELTAEQAKALYEKHFPPSPVITDEEKAKQAKGLEKQMLDLFVSQGNDPQDFYKIKSMAETDVAVLSDQEIKFELKKEGFSDDEIKDIINERYYQIEIDNMEQDLEETDEAFEARKKALQKRKDFFTKKLQNRSAYLQNTAKEVLQNLENTLSEQGVQAKKNAEKIAEIESVSKSLPRTVTLELGLLNDQPIDPVSVEVTEAEVESVIKALKDPEQQKQYFFNAEGELDYHKLADLILKKNILNKVARESLFEGQTRQVAIFKQTFPMDVQSLGVGGSSSSGTGVPGKLKSVGKPIVVNEQRRR